MAAYICTHKCHRLFWRHIENCADICAGDKDLGFARHPGLGKGCNPVTLCVALEMLEGSLTIYC